MTLLGALLAAEAGAFVLSLLLVRRRTLLVRELRGVHVRPPCPDWTVPALLGYALAADLAMLAIGAALAGAPRPFAGVARALYHLHVALFLGWPAALAVAACRLFDGRRVDRVAKRVRRPPRAAVPVVVGVWIGLVVGLAALHPLARGRTAAVLHAAELAAVIVAGVAIGLSWGIVWGQRHLVVGLLVAIEGTLALLGPWAHDVFRDWPRLARLPYLLGFGAAVVLHAAWLRRR